MSNKKGEEVNLIVKKMNKFCKLNNNNSLKVTKKQSSIMSSQEQQEREQQSLINNNDENFISEYPQEVNQQRNQSLSPSSDDYNQQPQDGRVSGGSTKSLSSTSSAFYDECEESEDTSHLLASMPASNTTTSNHHHHLMSSTNSLLSTTTSDSTSDHSGRSSANKTPDSLNGNCNTTRSQHLTSASCKKKAQQQIVKLLNPTPNLLPENKNYHKMVDRIRVRFLETIGEQSSSSSSLSSNKNNNSNDDETEKDVYDKNDIEELKKPLPPISKQEQSLSFRLISRYLNNKKVSELLLEKKNENNSNDTNNNIDNEIEQCVESLKSLLKFRQHYKLSYVLEEQFSKEFYILSGAFVFGHDKSNLPVFYMRARVHRRWSKTLDETFRRYLSWQIDLITKSNHGVTSVKKTIGLNGIEKDGSFGICFDCGEVGYSCLDMDFLRFIVNLLVNYYPTYCRYALCTDLPWLFRSVWKLVKSWLPEDAQNSVQLITSKQLVDFIDEEQIPNCIKVNELKASEKPVANKHSLPDNWSSIKGIEELGKDMNLNSNEIKQFKAHVDKLRKEYESVGAV